jgi:ADP-heptose:LPS heptosyltransferase
LKLRRDVALNVCERRQKPLIQSSVRRVLLATSGHVGNNLFFTPAIAFLKRQRPDIEFDVLAFSRRGASVFERNPHVGRVHTAYTRWRARRHAAGYDLVIGLQWDTARAYLAGSSVPAFFTEDPDRSRHRADVLLDFAAGWTGGTVEESDRRYVLCPGAEQFAAIERRLRGLGSGDVPVGFHLGTGRTASHGWKFFYRNRGKDPRIWPLDRYVSLAGRLREALPGARVILTGVRNERFLGNAFERAVPGTINLMGRTSLLELAALMTRLRAFVSNDNGALHIACSTDVPVVGLFGPSFPVHTGMYPPRPYHVAIKRERIEDIDPEEVPTAILRVIRPDRRS